MATNAIGLNLLLQASTQQLQDLIQGLQPGAALRGRVVDLLPQDKAIINLAGQNLVAQLPVNAALQKGDILNLLVTQSAAPSSGSSATAAPSLTLRLVTTNDVPLPGPTAANSPSNLTAAPVQAPPQAVLEQALTAARLPVNSATLVVAQTLASHGLPLDAQTLQAVVQQAENLLGIEQASAQATAAAQSAPPLAPQDQASLQQALPALRFALQTSPAAEPRLGYQQAANLVAQVLDQASVSPASLPLQSPSLANIIIPIANPAVHAPILTSEPSDAVLVSEPEAVAPAQTSDEVTLNSPHANTDANANPNANANTSSTANLNTNTGTNTNTNQNAVPSLQAALQAVLEAPSPINIQALQTALNELADAPAVAANPIQVPLIAVQASAAAPPALEALPVRRETAVLLLQAVTQEASPVQTAALPLGSPPTPFQIPVAPSAVLQAAQALNSALSQPQSPQSQALVRAVQVQYPASQAPQILQEARSALQEVAAHFEALPAGRTFSSPPMVANQLEAAGLPATGTPLSQWPRETVFEAVAWLAARDLPPQRPLVQAAAQFLSKGQPALELAHQAANAKGSLPESILQWRPNLSEAFASLDQALQRATLNLDGPDLANQLMQWPQASGMSLEKSLLDAFQAPATAVNNGSAQAAPSLREALANVQESLKQALQDPAGAAPSVAPKLQQALLDTSHALQSLSALPLQAQATPSFQSVTLPLALPALGPLQNGQLTVTWRQGQDKALHEKDPVNVGVVLNTESLGEVKVLLQVWKGHANAIVKAQDSATAAFLAQGAAELKQGFAERTPFQLLGLDFAVSQAGESDTGVEAPLPSSGSLNLSA